MSWLSWHQKSERLASDAYVLARSGAQERAVQVFAEAAEAEQNALFALDKTKTRTFGITAVSAVSLWFKARKFAAAEKAAYYGLASSALPAFATEELRNLLQVVWIEHAKRNAGVSFLPGQVTVSVKGGSTIPGGAPLDLIIEKVQTVQALFFRTIEFIRGSPHRKHGGPSVEIQEACKPWLFQALPGSYRFSVSIEEPRQPDFFKEAGPDAEQVAYHFMSILKASGEDPINELKKLVPSEEYRGTFLKLTRNLAPTGKNFSRIEISSTDDISGISLGPENRKVINRVLRPKRLEPDVETETDEEIRGILRALHLEEDWLEVLVSGISLRIDGLDEALDDVIGPMVNRPVIVFALRSKKGRLRFKDIEIDD